jgi:hypothetical protein
MKKLILNKKIQILKKKKKNNLNSVHWNYQNIRLNIWFILYFSNTGFGILRTWHVLRGPTKSRLLQPPSTRVQNPHLVAEKGKIVKLHKLAILLSQSQQGYSCTSTSQHNLSLRSRGSAYSHIRRELFLSCRWQEWEYGHSDVARLMGPWWWGGRGWPTLTCFRIWERTWKLPFLAFGDGDR